MKVLRFVRLRKPMKINYKLVDKQYDLAYYFRDLKRIEAAMKEPKITDQERNNLSKQYVKLVGTYEDKIYSYVQLLEEERAKWTKLL